MSTSEKVDGVDDKGSWKKLMEEAKAATDNESQMESRLTDIVLGQFRNRFAEESTGNKEKEKEKKKKKKRKLFVEEKGIESCPGTISGTGSLEEGDKEEYQIKKHKKLKTGNIEKKKKKKKDKQKAGSEEGDKEEYEMKKHKKQKTGNIEKKTKKTKKQKQKQKQNAGNGSRKNQKKKVDLLAKLAALGLEPPPDMPEAFKNCIANLGGTDVKLIIQKFIEKTDLSRQHNRLSLSKKRSNTFLSKAEEQILKLGMDVTFVEPRLVVSELHLTEWNIGSSYFYVLNNQWNQVVKNNADSLKPKAVVQIWSFRTPPNSKLGLAMIKVRDGEDGQKIDQAMS